MTTIQILSMVCGGWIIFMLGFFTAALLAAAKRESKPHLKLWDEDTQEWKPLDRGDFC